MQQIKGYIISYDNMTSRDITNTNNYLFGRIIKSNTNRGIKLYYYRGLLHDNTYSKLANGCYFITKASLLKNITENLNHITIRGASLYMDNKELIVAQQYFKNKYKNQLVINLG